MTINLTFAYVYLDKYEDNFYDIWNEFSEKYRNNYQISETICIININRTAI